MAIRFPEPPPQVSATEGAPVPAQPVFTLGLDDLREAGGGADAQESVTAPPTWRYSRFDAAGNVEVLELRETAESGAVSTGDDRFGPMIREALAVASEDPRAGEHDYEARLFRVPALSLLALWLHAVDAFDLFVPVGRAPRGLEPNRVYTDDEFMSAVRAAAEQVGSLYESAEAPDELGS
jgi:hypothetical protein